MTKGEILNNVIEICQPPKIYSLQEAQAIVPYLQIVTARHEAEVQRLIKQQQKLVKNGAPNHIIEELQKEVNDHMVRWGTKVRKLGGWPLAGGAVGIDGGGFYWSWFLGEQKIEYYHSYTDSPGNRRYLSVKI